MIEDRLRGRIVIASVSGGKDSAAMSLYLRERGIEHVRVFADTGWEHPATYEHVRGELTRVLGPIEEVRAPVANAELLPPAVRLHLEYDADGNGFWTLPAVVVWKGMFPSRTRRFCTTELKVKPLSAFVRRYMHERGVDVINAVGIRAQESASRARFAEWEWSDTFDCEVWRPLLGWSEEDVIAIHRRHGLKPNPLYLMGASRVGCWPCIHARKSEIRMLAERDPSRVDVIRGLEDEVGAASAARHEARGETIESAGHQQPHFFQAPLRDADGGRPMWPIDRVVAWSKTSRGGRHLELFSDPSDGCARWGMCEGSAS